MDLLKPLAIEAALFGEPRSVQSFLHIFMDEVFAPFYVVAFVNLLMDRRTSRSGPTGSIAYGHYELGESDTHSSTSQTQTRSLAAT